MTDTPKRRNRARSPINPEALSDAYYAAGVRAYGEEFDSATHTLTASELNRTCGQWRKTLSYLRMNADTPQRKEAEAALVKLNLSYTDGLNNSRTFHDVGVRLRLVKP
jgi:hypothetical protein